MWSSSDVGARVSVTRRVGLTQASEARVDAQNTPLLRNVKQNPAYLLDFSAIFHPYVLRTGIGSCMCPKDFAQQGFVEQHARLKREKF